MQTNLLNFLPSRPIEEIASEFIEAFDELYEPSNYLNRIYRYSTRLGRDQARRRPAFKSFFAHLKRPQALIGMLRLLWNQGVVRETGWNFWRYLLVTAIRRPRLLDRFLWIALLNEHFLEYRSLVRQEVSKQLRWSSSHRLAEVAA